MKNKIAILNVFEKSIECKIEKKRASWGNYHFGISSKSKWDLMISLQSRYGGSLSLFDPESLTFYANVHLIAKRCGIDMAIDFLIEAGKVKIVNNEVLLK